MAKLAAQYFMNSLTENQYGGLFYLAHIMKNQEYTTMEEHEVREFYVYGAAMGDPMCYFQMAQMYLSLTQSSARKQSAPLPQISQDGSRSRSHGGSAQPGLRVLGWKASSQRLSQGPDLVPSRSSLWICAS
jgi:hypothetical protein